MRRALLREREETRRSPADLVSAEEVSAFLKLEPEAIGDLAAPALWRLLRSLTREEVEQVRVLQWLAVLQVVDPESLRDPARRGRRFDRLFLSGDEHRQLSEQFDADVTALRTRFEHGPEPGETLHQLGERLLTQLLWLATERYAGLWNGLRLPAPRGRRPSFKMAARTPAPAGGRPRKITAESEAWFLAEIDAWRTRLAKKGTRVTDAKALRHSIASYYYRRYLSEGLSDAVAKREARRMAQGPVFRTRRVTLSNLRGRLRR